ncbi:MULTISPECIES: hypothetical protein [Azospirillum]|uniref:Phage ABA sandwich domain-containing protein n=1 Tax=Azospirillum brasilense TaxID=192 RepID=A0ABU4NZ59_AZOBR|nr:MULTISPECIES: hypothetical protein [Azospirillum]MDW7555362.1 hypothetical protein [Azospirillum brasilense]MDW7595230.1 hypothetical protein [Azospirillum brasilense]MDW7630384.1 hypothetical protein [Azospirillum brasilense]MDX5949751.1 hypothetical protein [Azospirillum brasilense]OPH16881.1 hypothetical protein FE89_02680 [Azospirillum brasilense]
MTDTKSTLLELAARVEAAEGPSRELDARIEQRLHPQKPVLLDPGSVGRVKREPKWGVLADFTIDGWDDFRAVADAFGAPSYTANADAAFQLFPNGWSVTVQWFHDGYPVVSTSASRDYGRESVSADAHGDGAHARSVVAAALRARAALKAEG